MFTRNHVTELLEERWLACYRVYDDNPKHALNSFDNNESDRFDKLTGLSEEKLGRPITKYWPTKSRASFSTSSPWVCLWLKSNSVSPKSPPMTSGNGTPERRCLLWLKNSTAYGSPTVKLQF